MLNYLVPNKLALIVGLNELIIETKNPTSIRFTTIEKYEKETSCEISDLNDLQLIKTFIEDKIRDITSRTGKD